MRFLWVFLAGVLSVTASPAQEVSPPALGLDDAASAAGHPEFRLLKLDGRPVKWGDAAFGQSAIVTYTVVHEDMVFSDARNWASLGPVTPMLSANGIDEHAFDEALTAAFSSWQSVADIRFERVDASAAPDIRIGADLGHHGWAHADVKHAVAEGEVQQIERGLVCLNPQRAWKTGFGANPEAQDIKYTLTHEIGHAIGLNHASPRGQLMSFTYGEDFADLQLAT